MNKKFHGFSNPDPPATGGGVEEAPSDSVYYGRRNGLWVNLKTYFDTLYQAVGSYLTSANIEDAINNGETTKAPTENAVYDALTGKSDTSHTHSYQPLDWDLTDIAGLSPSDDDIIQRKAGTWVNRTLAQLITDLTEAIQDLIGAMVSSNSETGITVTYDDTGGKLDFSVTPAGVGAVPNDGWIAVTSSWSYASASTITIPTDGTTVYQKGMKIRFKQGGGYKYYVAKTVAATLITVFVNTDYTVANAAITDVAYSYIENPYGFPAEFNYTPTFNNFTANNATLFGKMEVHGARCIQKAGFIFGSTPSVITGTLNLVPLATPLGLGTTQEYFGATTIRDTGTALYEGTVYLIGGNLYPQVSATGGAYAAPANVTATVPMTFVATDELSMVCEYTY